MVTTTADLTVLHVSDGIIITYETGVKDAFEGVFEADSETVYNPSSKGFIPLSVRGVALAYTYMNDEPIRVYLVPSYRPDVSWAMEALLYEPATGKPARVRAVEAWD